MRGYVFVKNSLKMAVGDVSNVYDVCVLLEEGKEQFQGKLFSLEEPLG